MNRDDVISMAREAGLLFGETEQERFYDYMYGWQQYASFAALVARRVLDGSYPEMIALVAAAEREACAKVCEYEWGTLAEKEAGEMFAVAIRARGEKE
jgi:hypothetical protein